VIIKILHTKYAVITSTNDFIVYKHKMCDILMCARSWTDGQLPGGWLLASQKDPATCSCSPFAQGLYLRQFGPPVSSIRAFQLSRFSWNLILRKSLEEHKIWVQSGSHFTWPEQVLLPPAPLRHRRSALLLEWYQAVRTGEEVQTLRERATLRYTHVAFTIQFTVWHKNSAGQSLQTI